MTTEQPGTPSNCVDLSLLGDADATVQLEVRVPTFPYGDTVVISWVNLRGDVEMGKHDWWENPCPSAC